MDATVCPALEARLEPGHVIVPAVCCHMVTYSASDRLWRSKQSRWRCLSLGQEYREY